MAKYALTISRQDLVDLNRIQQLPNLTGMMLADAPEGFLRCLTQLEDRAACETDPSRLQLIPYIVVRREDTGQILSYARGTGGAEARLHGKLSIGIGGHVDTELPASEHDEDRSDVLLTHITDHAERETVEELGVKFYSDEADDELEVRRLDNNPYWTGMLIYDDTKEEGTVHLGLLYGLDIPDPSYLGQTEAGVIESVAWNSLEELMVPPLFERMENWSKTVIESLYIAEHEENEDAEDDSGDEGDEGEGFEVSGD
jgi:predicted NUDIX family phosphoesterase